MKKLFLVATVAICCGSSSLGVDLSCVDDGALEEVGDGCCSWFVGFLLEDGGESFEERGDGDAVFVGEVDEVLVGVEAELGVKGSLPAAGCHGVPVLGC